MFLIILWCVLSICVIASGLSFLRFSWLHLFTRKTFFSAVINIRLTVVLFVPSDIIVYKTCDVRTLCRHKTYYRHREARHGVKNHQNSMVCTVKGYFCVRK